jgi:signal transduction histidine kinase
MRRTVRLRLTLLYGGLFLVSGVLLIGLVGLLAAQAVGPMQPPRMDLPGPAPPGPPLPGWMQDRIAQQRADDVGGLLRSSGIALAVMTAVSLGLGWLMAGRVLRPLGSMTATVRRISADDLDRRLAATGPDDELTELADTFDALLDRLQAAFAAQRRFVANASHELRTPLALQRAVIEVTLADPDADAAALRDALARLLQSGEDQERLIEALLTLARSQQGLPERHDVDVGVAARAALDALDGRDRVDADLAPVRVAGDPELIQRLVANLLENAVRHSPPGTPIALSVAAVDGRALIRVANPGGAAVPPDRVADLLEPFRRAVRGADRRGAGLGLSIVAAVAEAHGGGVRLRPLAEGGLEVTAGIPAVPR